MLTTIEFVALFIAPFGPELAWWLLNWTRPDLGAPAAGEPIEPAGRAAGPGFGVARGGGAGERAIGGGGGCCEAGRSELDEVESPMVVRVACGVAGFGMRRGGREEVDVGANAEAEVDAVRGCGSDEAGELVGVDVKKRDWRILN